MPPGSLRLWQVTMAGNYYGSCVLHSNVLQSKSPFIPRRHRSQQRLNDWSIDCLKNNRQKFWKPQQFGPTDQLLRSSSGQKRLGFWKPTYQTERFPKPCGLFRISIWKKAHRKTSGKGRPNQTNLTFQSGPIKFSSLNWQSSQPEASNWCDSDPWHMSPPH